MSVGYDATFELNDYSQPKLLSPIETVKNALLYVLFSKPGQYPSLPHIGMDIESKLYAHYDDLDTAKLKSDIISQCSALNEYIDNGTIDIRKTRYHGKPSLLITIAGNAVYPTGYLHNSSNKYLIGLTFNEVNDLIYNINEDIEEEE